MFTRKILCYIIVFSVSLTLYADFKNLIANGNFAENDSKIPYIGIEVYGMELVPMKWERQKLS